VRWSSPASLANHYILDDPGPSDRRLSRIRGLRTLVVHGTPIRCSRPLTAGRSEAIPGARMIELEDVGHQLPPPLSWAFLVDKLVEHTSRNAA
jgi:hypothetical protein